MRDVDLRALGAVLNVLFCGDSEVNVAGGGGADAGAGGCLGEPSAGNMGSSDGRRKRGKRRSAGLEGLPIYLSSIISALSDTDISSLNTKSGQRYHSAKDVYLDLKLLAENLTGPLGRTGQLDELAARGRLMLMQQDDEGGGRAFYGRQVQMSMLLHLFQGAAKLGNRPLMATIAGHSGTG